MKNVSCPSCRIARLLAGTRYLRMAVGIDKIIEHYGISLHETMAFGDGGNDMAMLRHAGIGVAMGNAGDEVKEAADYVTDSVDDDGVMNALRHFDVI